MSIQDRITEDVKAAMRAGEALRRDTLRMLVSSFKTVASSWGGSCRRPTSWAF